MTKETVTYTIRNSLSGSFWGFGRTVSEYPDARKFTAKEYRRAVNMANDLGGNWFVERQKRGTSPVQG